MPESTTPRYSHRKITLTVIISLLVVIVLLFAYFVGTLFISLVQKSEQPVPGPIDIFPRYYLPPACPPDSGANRFNSTYMITRADDYTNSSIEKWNTSLPEVYKQVIHSETFLAVSKGRSWIVVSWNYTLFNGRPVVQSTFTLLNQNGTVYGYLQPIYYYLDDHSVSISINENNVRFISCPANVG